MQHLAQIADNSLGFPLNPLREQDHARQASGTGSRDLVAGLGGQERWRPDDNFFALGGHSLLGVKMIAEIQAKTGMEEELKLADLLEFPTLGAFTAHLESLMAPSEESGSI